MRVWRVAAIVAAGSVMGLAWNVFGGRGIALSGNAYIKPGEDVVEIDAAEAKKRLEKAALFLDARPVAFYEMGHIPGARPLPEDDFDREFARIVYHYRLIGPSAALGFVPANTLAVTLPWIEALAGLLLIVGVWRREAALTAALLLVMFLAAVGWALAHGIDVENCGCFSV